LRRGIKPAAEKEITHTRWVNELLEDLDQLQKEQAAKERQ